MATAIKLRNSKNVLMENVFISGFNRGIEAVDSDLLLSRVNVERCGIGVDLINSDAILHNSRLVDNVIDVVVNKSKVRMIDTIAHRVLEILPRGDYRINPYQIESIATAIINTRDVQEKRIRFRQLLNVLKRYTHVWVIYSVIKEILRLAAHPF